MARIINRISLLPLLVPLLTLLFLPGNCRGQSSATPAPDCIFFISASLTGGSAATISYPSSAGFDNRSLGCQTWTFNYAATATSGTLTTLDFQSAAGAVSAGSFATWAGTISTGINPNTSSVIGTSTFSTGCASAMACNVNNAWVKILLTRNNFVGTIRGVLYGYRTGYAGRGSGGGGGGGGATVLSICLDSNASHTGAMGVEFVCNTSPSFVPVPGSMVLFRFAAAGNAAAPHINVNGLGLLPMDMPDQGHQFGQFPTNGLQGDAYGVENFYPLVMNPAATAWIPLPNPSTYPASVTVQSPVTNGLAYSVGTSPGVGNGLIGILPGCVVVSTNGISCTGPVSGSSLQTYYVFRALNQNTVSGSNFSIPASNPPTMLSVEGANSGDVTTASSAWNYGTLSFAANGSSATSNSVQGVIPLPTTWPAGSGITLLIKWRTTATTGNVSWRIQGQCVATLEVPGNFGTAVAMAPSTAPGTTLQWKDTAVLAMSTGDVLTGCAAGEVFLFRLFRDHQQGADTLTSAAEMIMAVFAVPQ